MVTISAYWPVLGADFVNYDDDIYVTENPNVLEGLTLDGAKWAFSMDGYASNWHPLTWLSHMLDCELFGQDAGLHHLTNLLLHTANSVLLLLVLASMTRNLWPSAFVAAAFALHPLHVESVAWIAERKDVLSGLFWMLTMACYLRFTRRGSRSSCILTLVVFALGLMAKPMLVTLPFVLLLLDYWPLERLEFAQSINRLRAVRPFIVEKIPFFILAGASCVVTYISQQAGGAVTPIESLPFSSRLSNAMVSNVAYIVKMVWPADLAVLYPLKQIPLWQSILALIAIAAITVAAVFCVRRMRHFVVGWLWYLGTLVPVMGLVQVGVQSHADRYSYIPLIGLFMAIAWAVADCCRGRARLQFLSIVAAILLLAGMVVGTRNQISYWKDSISLCRRAIQVTENNYVMHNNLGFALANSGQRDEAISHYRRALQIAPDYVEPLVNLGLLLPNAGQLKEAIGHLRRALQIDPDNIGALNNLGLALEKKGQLNEAVNHYRRALQIDFNNDKLHNNLGYALSKSGRLDEAIAHYRLAIQINSDFAKAHENLGFVLAKSGQLDKAIGHYRRVVQIKPEDAETHYNLGLALAKTDQLGQAVDHYRQALKLQPQQPPVINNLAWILATASDPALQNTEEAVRLAETVRDLTGHKNAGVLDTLAVAYASAGRFNDAVSTAEKALEIAEAVGNENLAQEIRGRIELFKEGRKYIEKPEINNNMSE
ncbi:MAG: tetratricopeptide repeat protein [Planctomycetota bacterium]